MFHMLKVVMVGGSRQEEEGAHLLLATPEKWDALQRRGTHRQVDLLMLDEL